MFEGYPLAPIGQAREIVDGGRIRVCMCICVCMYVCVCLCTCVCVSMYVCMHICVRIAVYISVMGGDEGVMKGEWVMKGE